MSRVAVDKVTDEVLARERGAWRAVVRLPADMAAAPGVMGSATAEGPWVDGYGAGPYEAVRDAVHAAGLALLRRMEGERRAAEVELHEKPALVADTLKALEDTFRRWGGRDREGAKNNFEKGLDSVGHQFKASADAWDAAADEVKKVAATISGTKS